MVTLGPSRRLPAGANVRWEDLVVYRQPGPTTTAWRWRTEITLGVALVAGWYLLDRRVGLAATAVSFVAGLLVALALPWTRRRGRCVVTRHRMYAALREIRATTRTGRLPLILRVSPSTLGERVVVWCRAGITARQMQAGADQIGAACWASRARVSRHPVRTQIVVIEIIRRGL